MNTLYIAKPSDSATEKALIAILDALQIDYDLNENGDNKNIFLYDKIKRSEDDISAGRVYELDLNNLDEILNLD